MSIVSPFVNFLKGFGAKKQKNEFQEIKPGNKFQEILDLIDIYSVNKRFNNQRIQVLKKILIKLTNIIEELGGKSNERPENQTFCDLLRGIYNSLSSKIDFLEKKLDKNNLKKETKTKILEILNLLKRLLLDYLKTH